MDELITLQRQGRAIRLYPDKRDGPDDEGVAPLSISLEGDVIRIDRGRPGVFYLLEEKDLTCIAPVLQMASKIFMQKGTAAEVIDASDAHGDGVDIHVYTDGERIVTVFGTEALEIRLGITKALKFIGELWLAGEDLGWGQFAAGMEGDPVAKAFRTSIRKECEQ